MNPNDNMPLATLKELERTTETALREIREKREAVERRDADIRLEHLKPIAIRAHDLLCQWSHCDGCGWGYEMDGQTHGWTGWAHARWLQWVESLVMGTDRRYPFRLTMEELSEVLDAVENLKQINPRAMYLIRSGVNAP